MGKLTNLAQMKLAALRAQQEIAAVAEAALAAAGAEYLTISIPVSSWTANTDATLSAEGYAYMADAACEGITAEDGTEAEVAKDSRAEANACGLAEISETVAGAIRFYAENIPAAALSLEILVFRA